MYNLDIVFTTQIPFNPKTETNLEFSEFQLFKNLVASRVETGKFEPKKYIYQYKYQIQIGEDS